MISVVTLTSAHFFEVMMFIYVVALKVSPKWFKIAEVQMFAASLYKEKASR